LEQCGYTKEDFSAQHTRVVNVPCNVLLDKSVIAVMFFLEAFNGDVDNLNSIIKAPGQVSVSS
jgi:hypothetical protein